MASTEPFAFSIGGCNCKPFECKIEVRATTNCKDPPYYEGATVYLKDQYGATIDTATTDANGMAILQPTEDGQYWVSATAPDGCTMLGDPVEVNVRCYYNCTSPYYCQACSQALLYKQAAITDANGAHNGYNSPWVLGWIDNPYSTSNYGSPLLQFHSHNIWYCLGTDPSTDPAEGTAAYGFYWYCTATEVVLAMRLYLMLCPGYGDFTQDRVYDHEASVVGGNVQVDTSYWVEWIVKKAADSCDPFSTVFDFPATPTRYGDYYGVRGTGYPPHGTVTRPVNSATLAVPVQADPVYCMGPCDTPMKNLKLSIIGGSLAGDVTLVYTPQSQWRGTANGRTWTWGPYGLSMSMTGFTCSPSANQLQLYWYTCEPWLLKFRPFNCSAALPGVSEIQITVP